MSPKQRSILPRVLLALVLLAGAGFTLAQEELTGHPGFVDFAGLELFGEDELEIHVSVKDPLLRLVAETTRRSDPELAEMLDGLRGIELRVYETPEGERGAVRELIDALAGQLRNRSWQSALTVRAGRSYGHVFLRLDGDVPQGLAAMLLDEDNQAVFVNIVGEVDPSELGRLASRFGVESLSEDKLKPVEDGG